MGNSDKPIMRYSTKEMALDLIELLDHLGWTKERQLHITGVSMGGMISQELVCATIRGTKISLTATGLLDTRKDCVSKPCLYRALDREYHNIC